MKSKKPPKPPTQKDMARIFLCFMAQHLDQWPDMTHAAAPGAHAAVPPCNWPELIASIVARAIKDAKEKK